MTKFIDLSDCRLNVCDVGTGPVLLFVHGFPLDCTMWLEQVNTFAASHRVIAPDLRGFGQSTGAGETIAMSQLADDLAALLDTLDVQEPVTLCGLSMGGYVAWEFWRRHKARLARLILCDTRAVGDTPEAARGRQMLASKVLSQGSSAAAEAMLPKLLAQSTATTRPDVVKTLKQTILDTRPDTIAGALRGLATRDDFSSLLPQIAVPTLVLCGAHDAISPPAEMRGLAAAMPNARFVEIPDAGHMSVLEAPVAANAAIREFLEVNL